MRVADKFSNSTNLAHMGICLVEFVSIKSAVGPTHRITILCNGIDERHD